jgi:hypothetical protein
LFYYAGDLGIPEEGNHASSVYLDAFSTNKHIYQKINQRTNKSTVLVPNSLIYSQNFLAQLVPADGGSMMLRNVCNSSPVNGVYYPVKL